MSLEGLCFCAELLSFLLIAEQISRGTGRNVCSVRKFLASGLDTIKANIFCELFCKMRCCNLLVFHTDLSIQCSLSRIRINATEAYLLTRLLASRD